MTRVCRVMALAHVYDTYMSGPRLNPVAFRCVSKRMGGYVSLCVYESLFVCECMGACVCVCVRAHAHACACVYVCANVGGIMHARIHTACI